MRKIIFVLVLVTTLLLGCTQMSAEEIAKKMEEKYKSIEDMKGTITITTEFQGEKQVHTTSFAMKGNKYRSEDENSIIVSNGKTMRIYDKKKNEVVKMELPETEKPEFDYGKFIKNMLENNDVKLAGGEKVSGRDCYVIEVTPKNETFYAKQKLWIDKEFWYPIKIEINYGEFSSAIEYQIEFNTGISDDVFEFTPPEGTKVVEQKFEMPKKLTIEDAQKQVNFTIITPDYTAGYEFSHAMAFKFGNKEAVSLYYKKDEKMLTISESTGSESRPMPNATKVKIEDREGEVAEIFGNRMLRFHIDGIEVVIAGKVSKEELVRVAESMV